MDTYSLHGFLTNAKFIWASSFIYQSQLPFHDRNKFEERTGELLFKSQEILLGMCPCTNRNIFFFWLKPIHSSGSLSIPVTYVYRYIYIYTYNIHFLLDTYILLLVVGLISCPHFEIYKIVWNSFFNTPLSSISPKIFIHVMVLRGNTLSSRRFC